MVAEVEHVNMCECILGERSLKGGEASRDKHCDYLLVRGSTQSVESVV